MPIASTDKTDRQPSPIAQRCKAPVILRNERFEATLLTNHGGALHRFMFTRSDGSQVNVVAGYDNLDDYKNDNWEVSRMVAPSIGRIRGASYQIEGYDKLTFPTNAGEHSLHSGGQGSETRLPDNPTIVNINSSGNSVVFHWNNVESHGGRIKYGFTLKYELLEDGYAVEILTSVDPESEPFYLNPADHTYRLNGGEESDGGDQVLTIDADQVLEMDHDLLPTGERHPVSGALDFRNGSRTGDLKLDNYFILNNAEWLGLKTVEEYNAMREAGIELAHVATLRDPASGITLDVEATAAGVQVFNGWENGAVALEPMIAPPDSIHLEEFREGVIAKPGRRYITRIEYHYREQ